MERCMQRTKHVSREAKSLSAWTNFTLIPNDYMIVSILEGVYLHQLRVHTAFHEYFSTLRTKINSNQWNLHIKLFKLHRNSEESLHAMWWPALVFQNIQVSYVGDVDNSILDILSMYKWKKVMQMSCSDDAKRYGKAKALWRDYRGDLDALQWLHHNGWFSLRLQSNAVAKCCGQTFVWIRAQTMLR